MQSLELIVYHLQKSGESIENAMDESWPLLTDSLHPVNMSIFEVSSMIYNIKTLLDKLLARHTTQNVIEFLDKSKVDYTLLLYLQLPASIVEKSELISYLGSLCSSMKADFRSRHFYDSVWNHFERKGIRSVTPDKYIIANKKDELLAEYEKVKKSWGKHNPLFIQTYDTQDGKFTNHLYHITRTVQDGISRLFDILKAGEFAANGRLYKACGAFEHIIGPSTLTCQIFDCEIMSTVFDDRKTTEEIKEMVKCFPQCISSIMISEDLVNVEDIVTYAVKDRTRRINDDTVKISYHFIPNICAYKSVHREAMEICLKECKGRIDEANTHIKGTGILPENLLFGGISDSLLALDVSAIKSNGFTTAFSRKKDSDPFSRLIYSEEVCAGATIKLHECLEEPQDLCSPNLTDDTRRMLIYTQLFTTPKREMLCYTEDALEALTTAYAQKNGVAQRPTPRPQRAFEDRSSSHPILPAWLVSALKEITGRDVCDARSELPFLQKLKSTLPEASRDATLYHIPSSWCANSMANDKVHVHETNGTVFAVDNRLGVVYATCSTGSNGHKITENNSQCIKVVNMHSTTNEDGVMQSVESVKGKCVHWIMADENSMRLLVETAKKNGMEPPTKKRRT